MDTSHDNIKIINDGLIAQGFTASFDITPALVKDVYHTFILPRYPKSQTATSTKTLIKLYEKQYEFVRRDLLKIKYIRNEYKAAGLKEGFVYAISNPAYPDYVKIGSSVDVYERLDTYQTYSPNRDFSLVNYYFSYDRFADETSIINSYQHKHEWCNVSIDEIDSRFSQIKKDNKIHLDTELQNNLESSYRLNTIMQGVTKYCPLEITVRYIKQFGYELFEKVSNINFYDVKNQLLSKNNWMITLESTAKKLVVNTQYRINVIINYTNLIPSSIVVTRY